MSKWFEDADITTSPAIPETVTKMDGTFSGCKKLSTAPSIPQSVKSMESTFERCTSLTTMKQVNQMWAQIYQIVKENCSSDYRGATPQDDVMERLLRTRKG